MNRHHTHNASNTQKKAAVCFKDVKSEETFKSQDQKLVATTNLWRQIFRTKNHHSAN